MGRDRMVRDDIAQDDTAQDDIAQGDIAQGDIAHDDMVRDDMVRDDMVRDDADPWGLRPAPDHRGTPVGVLVMAYGGPDSPEDIPGYLADIRQGRTTPRRMVEEIAANYRRIGGRSPLLERTREQLEGIQNELRRRGAADGLKFYLGMRHWRPWIEETVGQMIEDGIRSAVSLVLAPHFSSLSVAKYQQRIADGLQMYRGSIAFEHVASYHDHPQLIAALAERVVEGVGRWPESERGGIHVTFTAHSLPARIRDWGDPYERQLLQTARLVADRVPLPAQQWTFCYQSAGRSREPWLGPQLDEHLIELASRGVRDLLVVPIGFVSDHVEVLYDIDIAAAQVAAEHGMRLQRPPALNDHPLLIAALADAIVDHVNKTLPSRKL